MDLILCVNDEPRNLILVTTQLLLENYQVVTASVQEDAIELARLLRPRLIFMDLVLHNGTGWEATRAIKELDDISAMTPIIVISARSDAADKARAFAAGADEYLTKPYDVKELKALVKRYLHPSGERGVLTG